MLVQTCITGIMRENNEKAQMRDRDSANGGGAPGATQSPGNKGRRSLEGVTYVSASDENGQMDDDLFDLLLRQRRSNTRPR